MKYRGYSGAQVLQGSFDKYVQQQRSAEWQHYIYDVIMEHANRGKLVKTLPIKKKILQIPKQIRYHEAASKVTTTGDNRYIEKVSCDKKPIVLEDRKRFNIPPYPMTHA